MTQKYKCRYTLIPEAGEFDESEIKASQGGCDSFIHLSMLYPSDGSYQQAMYGFDGNNGGKPPSKTDLFKAWILMCKNILDDETAEGTLEDWQIVILEHAWELMTKVMGVTPNGKEPTGLINNDV